MVLQLSGVANSHTTTSLCYSVLVLLITVACVGVSMAMSSQEEGQIFWNLYTACHSLGVFFSVLCLIQRRAQVYAPGSQNPLEVYARKFDFLAEWWALSVWRFVTAASVWGLMVLPKALLVTWLSGSCSPELCEAPESILPFVAFVAISFLLAAQSYYQMHICCGLELAIDKFCWRFFEDPDLPRCISEWNMLQAILRRTANTIDASFLALNTAVLATLLLTGAEVVGGVGGPFLSSGGSRLSCMLSWLCSVLLPMSLVFYTVFRAAAISEKCSHVPSLINSWTFEDHQIDHDRQYVVQYITHSAAGFYVKGVRLNAVMALKLTYLVGVIVFTLVTQSMLKR